MNINQLCELGFKPGRLIDIWEMNFGRQAIGCCISCSAAICPMRIMRKCGAIPGCYPSAAECCVIVNSVLYPGYDKIGFMTHRQRAAICGLICQNCWITQANCQTLCYLPVGFS